MRRTRKNTAYLKYFLIILMLSLVSYGCDSKPPLKKAAIKINEYTLSADEFNKVFSQSRISEDTPRTREAFLENLISRKLLLQEAQREGLDKQKDFLKSVENFWEQSLLKIVIDKKIKEVSGTISVTEREIEDYYNKWAKANPDDTKTLNEMRDVISWQLLREKQSLVLNRWIAGLKNKANINIDRKVIGIE